MKDSAAKGYQVSVLHPKRNSEDSRDDFPLKDYVKKALTTTYLTTLSKGQQLYQGQAILGSENDVIGIRQVKEGIRICDAFFDSDLDLPLNRFYGEKTLNFLKEKIATFKDSDDYLDLKMSQAKIFDNQVA